MSSMERPVDTPELENLRLLNYGTEFDLADAAVSYAKTLMPQWTPRQGNTEMVLIQALALMLGPETLAVNIMPYRMLEQLMMLYGVHRSPGLPAKGRMKILVTPSSPIQIIPAGTRFRMPVGASGLSVDVLTDDELQIITSDTLEGSVSVTAAREGSDTNGTPAGTVATIVDNLPFIEMAELDQPLEDGADVEGDSRYYGRATAVLGRLTSTLVLPEHFSFAALGRADVGRAITFNLYDPNTPGTPQAGHVTVAVADLDGLPLPAPDMENIRQDLSAKALASLTIHVIPPTVTTVDVAVTVRAVPGYTVAEVSASVAAALENWLDPANWRWESTVTKFGIVGVASQAAGVLEVTAAPDDIALPGKAPLAQAGTITVTVIT